MSKKKLFSEFSKTSTDEWESIIKKDLKGANYSKLITKTYDNIDIKPYYRKENLSNLNISDFPNTFPFTRGNYNVSFPHKIKQNIKVNDVASANISAIDLIKKGITSLCFIISSDIDLKNISSLLKDINLKNIQIELTLQNISKRFVDTLVEYFNSLKLSNVDFTIDFDPIGEKTISENYFYDNYIENLKYLYKNTLNINGFKILNINSHYFKDAGSSSVQELAFGLSIANEYLAVADGENFDIDNFASKMQFSFGVGSNYFMEIAKLRAARLLWAKIVAAYNIKDNNSAKMNIHSVTSDWNKTAYDPYVNVLRTTTEAMSAIIGGTDSLLVKPFNSSYEEANEFSERIARNIQIILNEEAYFDKFIDPAGGSYYIESLTNSIAENSWDLFLKVEKLGGYNKAFDSGFIKSQIEEIANKRNLAIAMKKEVLLGTNQYAARDEKLNFQIPKSKNVEGNTIRIYRGAEAFEELRQKTENASKTPKVLLLTFGNLAMRKARASFATNFFACAGFEIIENDVVNSVEEGLNQFNKTKADITVLCSSDDEYLEFASEINKEIADKTILTIAGYPKKHIDELQKIGIENFIYVKSNILEILTNFQNIILQN